MKSLTSISDKWSPSVAVGSALGFLAVLNKTMYHFDANIPSPALKREEFSPQIFIRPFIYPRRGALPIKICEKGGTVTSMG